MSFSVDQQLTEARRALAAPLFADVAGDAAVSLRILSAQDPQKMEQTLWDVGDRRWRRSTRGSCLGHLWRRRVDA